MGKTISKYEFVIPPKLIFGNGTIEEAPKEVSLLGRKCLLVTGKEAMRKTNVTNRLLNGLNKEGIETILFDGVEEDPSYETVMEGLKLAKEKGCVILIGLGGGSALDCAKAIAGVFNEQFSSLEEFEAGRPITKAGLPFIAIPTTSGSGSEVTKNSVLTNKKRKIKKSLRSPYFVASVAIIDPSLTLTLTPKLTAACGMDALTHAVEAYVSTGASPYTDALALKAIELIGKNLKRAYNYSDDLTARSNMSWASLLAGMAFSNAGLGAVHALAHPVGIRHNISHGLANAVLLPYVMEFNLSCCQEKFTKIALALAEDTKPEPEKAIAAVNELRRDLNIPDKLSELGIEESDLKIMVEDTKESASIKTNPYPTTDEDLWEILKNAL